MDGRVVEKNICDVDKFKLNSDIPDLKERQEKKVPSHLAYCCKHWVMHVVSSDIDQIENEESIIRHTTGICNEKLM